MTVDAGLLALVKANQGMSDRPAVLLRDDRRAQPGGRLPVAWGSIAPDPLANISGFGAADTLTVK